MSAELLNHRVVNKWEPASTLTTSSRTAPWLSDSSPRTPEFAFINIILFYTWGDPTPSITRDIDQVRYHIVQQWMRPTQRPTLYLHSTYLHSLSYSVSIKL